MASNTLKPISLNGPPKSQPDLDSLKLRNPLPPKNILNRQRLTEDIKSASEDPHPHDVSGLTKMQPLKFHHNLRLRSETSESNASSLKESLSQRNLAISESKPNKIYLLNKEQPQVTQIPLNFKSNLIVPEISLPSNNRYSNGNTIYSHQVKNCYVDRPSVSTVPPSEYNPSKALITQLEKECSTLNIRVKDLQQQLSRKTETEYMHVRELETYRTALTERDNPLQRADNYCFTNNNNIALAVSCYREMKDSNKVSPILLNSIQDSEMKLLKNEVSRLNDTLEDKNRQILDLRKEQLALDKQRDAHLNLEISNLQIKKLNDFLKDANLEIARTRGILESKDAQVVKLKHEIQRLRQNQQCNELAQDQISQAKNSISNLEYKLRQKDLEISGLVDCHNYLENKINSLQEIIDRKPLTLSVPNPIEQKLITDAHNKQVKTEIDFMGTVSSLKQEIAFLRHEQKKHRQAIETRDAQIKKMAEKSDSFQTSLMEIRRDYDMRIQALNFENDELKIKLRDIQYKLALKDASLESSKKAQQELSQKVGSLCQEMERLYRQNSQLQTEILLGLQKQNVSDQLNGQVSRAKSISVSRPAQRKSSIDDSERNLQLVALKNSVEGSLRNNKIVVPEITLRSNDEPRTRVFVRAHRPKAASTEQKFARIQTLESETGVYNFINLNALNSGANGPMEVSRQTRLLFNTEQSSLSIDTAREVLVVQTQCAQTQCQLLGKNIEEELAQKSKQLAKVQKDLSTALCQNFELKTKLQKLQDSQLPSNRSSRDLSRISETDRVKLLKEANIQLEARIEKLLANGVNQKAIIANLEQRLQQVYSQHARQVEELKKSQAKTVETLLQKLESSQGGNSKKQQESKKYNPNPSLAAREIYIAKQDQRSRAEETLREQAISVIFGRQDRQKVTAFQL